MNMHFSRNILILCSFIIFFATLSITSSLKESLTFDEIVDLQEGRNALLSHTFDIDPYNPPLTREVAAIPYILTKDFKKSEIYAIRYSFPARATSILFGIALLTTIFYFTKKYFGEKTAYLATFLFSFEPTILANSHYITMDVAVTLFFFLSIWRFFIFLTKKTIKNALILGIVIGLGSTTKISFLPYFFLSALALIVYWLLKNKKKSIDIPWKEIGIICIISLFTIWTSYLFQSNVIIKHRQDSSRVSAKTLQFANSHRITFLANTIYFFERKPIPLGDFLATLKNNALRNASSSECFFLGTILKCQWYFIPVTFFLKIPLSLFILFLTGIWMLLKQKKKNIFTIFLIVPIGLVMFVAMISRMTPLIRYILPLYPFLLIIAAASISFWVKTKVRKLCFIILLVWYIFSSLSAYPHFISYANEFAFGQKHFLLEDSNMDWGQSLPDIHEFILKNKPKTVKFSYFGRDNADWYGLTSNFAYGSFKNNKICQFHSFTTNGKAPAITLISISNWFNCGYNKKPQYTQKNIKSVIGDSVFLF